jgi:hypothetical protein
VRLAVDDAPRLEVWSKRTGISERSLSRLKLHPAYIARLTYLRERAAERALAEEPLAQKGARIALAGQMARTLKEQLEANGYVTTLGVSKQGNPITGFDRARVAEIRQYLALIADELDDKGARQASDTLAVQVTMTTADAVTKVQALLSRTADDEAGGSLDTDVYKEGIPPTPYAGGQGGVYSDTDTIDKVETVLDTEYTIISDTKEGEE